MCSLSSLEVHISDLRILVKWGFRLCGTENSAFLTSSQAMLLVQGPRRVATSWGEKMRGLWHKTDFIEFQLNCLKLGQDTSFSSLDLSFHIRKMERILLTPQGCSREGWNAMSSAGQKERDSPWSGGAGHPVPWHLVICQAVASHGTSNSQWKFTWLEMMFWCPVESNGRLIYDDWVNSASEKPSVLLSCPIIMLYIHQATC